MKFHTYEDYLSHPVFKVIRQTAIRLAKGKCQCCNANLATEVHHHKYPKPWGAFDTPGNMIAICHECHCKQHGKRQ